ncbi:GroES-like protein [Wolfiporia cocos MD-104 SS10]|uniref:GroES-like protein n=1 Tax=Wolfiporia cocos (strain MD-104) TaxID=742152 RepID=A0A2H3JHE2_WOLCO|nr:GroES-like protein [Wolfiporia cocos MD-104 SS10]
MSFAPPKTYKAYAFKERGGKLEEIELEWQDPKAGEVVVKVLACGVCASDTCVQTQAFPSVVYPRVPGHEIIGDVVAVGEGEQLWKFGDRVGAGWHGGHCHNCTRCRKGDYVTCSLSSQPNGIARNGGYAQYVTLRSEALANIPRDMDPAEAAPLMCAGVTTFCALRSSTVPGPEIAAIQGIGGLGHLAIQFARHMGYRVVALSTSDSKRELALQLGAHEFISGTGAEQAAALQKLGGARLVAATAPEPDAINPLIDGCTFDSEILVLPVDSRSLTIPIMPLLGKRLSVRGWPYGSGQDCEDTVQFARAHGIKSIVETFPLEKAAEAYERRASAKFRSVIIP